MSSPEVFDVVEQRLATFWSTTPVVYENENWPTPDTPAPFVLVELFGSSFEQESIGGGESTGANLWREEGHLYLNVMVPSGTGTREARALAKSVSNLFRGEDIGGVLFERTEIGAGAPGERDGQYFRMTATIAWQRDE